MGLCLIGQLEERWDITCQDGWYWEEGPLIKGTADVVITVMWWIRSDGLLKNGTGGNKKPGQRVLQIHCVMICRLQICPESNSVSSPGLSFWNQSDKKTLREVLERKCLLTVMSHVYKYQIRSPSTFFWTGIMGKAVISPGRERARLKAIWRELESWLCSSGIYLLMLKGVCLFHGFRRNKVEGNRLGYYLSCIPFFSGGQVPVPFLHWIRPETVSVLKGGYGKGFQGSAWPTNWLAVSHFLLWGLKEFYRALKWWRDISNWGLSVCVVMAFHNKWGKILAFSCRH